MGRNEDNVGRLERGLSLTVGAMAAAFGVRRRGIAGALATAAGGYLLYRGASGHCPGYSALGIGTAGRAASIEAGSEVTIDRPRESVYDFYRDFRNHVRFSRVVTAAEPIDERTWRYRARGPGGRELAWTVEITEDQPGRLVVWRTVGDAALPHEGRARFRGGSKGTEVEVRLRMNLPGGRLAQKALAIFGASPAQVVGGDLRRLKSLLEAGEIPTVEGQTSGRAASREDGGRELRNSGGPQRRTEHRPGFTDDPAVATDADRITTPGKISGSS